MIEPAENLDRGLVRVQASSYREALERIHANYGAGFRIVHTRVVKREGLMGMVGGRGVEVYLAPHGTDDYGNPVATGSGPRPSSPSPVGVAAEAVPLPEPIPLPTPVAAGGSAPGADVLSDVEEQVRRLLKANEARGATAPAPAPEPTPIPVAVAEVARSKNSLHAKVLLDALEKACRSETPNAAASPVESAPELAVAPATPSREPMVDRSKQVGPAHPVLRAACRLLLARGFSQEVASDLTSRLRESELADLGDVAEASESEVELLAASRLGRALHSKLPPCAPIAIPETTSTSDRPRVVAFVGPTGVGKTTSIAKLSAPLRLLHGRRVALITLDTFRLGAVDQIRRYAEIVGLEVHPVERPESLPEVVAKLSESDLIFIDTAGSSPKNDEQLDKVREGLSRLEDVETHLCLSASVSRDSLLAAAKRFRPVGYDRLLITKADEVDGAGQLIDLFQSAKVPVSYLTSGQEVPEDISTATARRLEKLIIGEQS